MKREVKIGIFAVAMIGVAWAGIRFLKGFDIFSRNVEYYAAYDQINAAADAAKAQLRAAQAQAEMADNASRYAELLADSDGVVMDTLAEPGQVVAAGTPVVRIAQDGARDAVFAVPEDRRASIRMGQDRKSVV